ncbi:MAG: hypothetical protein FWF50_04790 [Defluviitaleaceae bacterium]|nr:hypothetical protein [Defluviitaleaceae bacterium]
MNSEKKNKKSKVPLIAGSIVALIAVVGIVILTLNLGDRSSSPAMNTAPIGSFEALRQAEENWILRNNAMRATMPFTMDFLLSYTPSESLNQMASLFLGMEVPQIETTISGAVVDSGVAYLLNLMVDGYNIPIEFFLSNFMTVAVPGISDYFIQMSLENELYGLDTFSGFSEIFEMIEDFEDLPYKLLETYFYHIENTTTIHTNQTSWLLDELEQELNRFDINKTRFDIVITHELMRELINIYFEAFRDSEIFAEMERELLRALPNMEFNMNVWLNDRNEIVKRTITVINHNELESHAQLLYINIANDDERFIHLSVLAEETEFNLSTLLEKRGSGLYGVVNTGFNNNFDNFELEFSVYNIRIQDGILYGRIPLDGEVDTVSYSLNLEFGSRGAMQIVSITGEGGLFGMFTDIGELILGFGINEGETLTITDKNQAFAINPDEDFEALERMFEDILNFLRGTSSQALNEIASFLE